MKVEYAVFPTGLLESNACVVYEESKRCLIIDPSQGCSELVRFVEKQSLTPVAVLLTHGHFDHITGIPEIEKKYPQLPVYIHRCDIPMLRDSNFNGSVMLGMDFKYEGPVNELQEGVAQIGGFEFQVIHLPGHTPGGCALLFDRLCFSGDVLFAGSIGRSDFPGGNGEELIKGIKAKLLTLGDETVICPGHGGRTTVGREKKANPFLI